MNLFGDPFNLQGNGQSLQGGAAPVQGGYNPQQPANPYGPTTPVKAPAPVRPAAPAAPRPAPAPLDLSGNYGINNGTVFFKPTNLAFGSADEFYRHSGVKSFDGVRFDTAYQAPQQQPQQALRFGGTPPAPATPYTPKPTEFAELEKSVFAQPSQTSQQLYEQAYGQSGLEGIKSRITELNKIIADKQSKYTSKGGDINENPWLSEASRMGRLGRLSDMAEAELGNDIDELNSYTTLYNNGITELNNYVTRGLADQQLSRDLDTSRLEYITKQGEKAFTSARELGVNQPYFVSGNLVYNARTMQPVYEKVGAEFRRLADGFRFSDPNQLFTDAGISSFDQIQTLAPEQAELIELSEGATLYDPKTGEVVYTAPKTYKTGSGAGGSYGGGALSAEAQAVMNGTLKLEDLTPTVRGRIAGELTAAGYTRTEGLNAGQRTQIDQLDTLLREAQSAQGLLDSGLNTGQLASRVAAGKAIAGGAAEFTNYRSIVNNLSSILLNARSGAAVTPEEYNRIKGFIPLINDDEKTAQTKIKRFMEEMNAARQNYIKRSTQTSQQIAQGSGAPTGGGNANLSDLNFKF